MNIFGQHTMKTAGQRGNEAWMCWGKKEAEGKSQLVPKLQKQSFPKASWSCDSFIPLPSVCRPGCLSFRLGCSAALRNSRNSPAIWTQKSRLLGVTASLSKQLFPVLSRIKGLWYFPLPFQYGMPSFFFFYFSSGSFSLFGIYIFWVKDLVGPIHESPGFLQ